MIDKVKAARVNSVNSDHGWIVETHFLPFPYGHKLNKSFRNRCVKVIRHQSLGNIANYQHAVYLLHGFGYNANGADFWLGKGYADTLDILLLLKDVNQKEILNTVFVCPDGSNCLGGTMWENSEFNGPISDWLTHDVTKFIDERYGTANHREYRILAGHSMGAQASTKLLITRPETFGSAYAFSGMMSFGIEEHERYATHWYAHGCPTPQDILAGNFDEMIHAYSAMCLAFCDNHSPSGSIRVSDGQYFFRPAEPFFESFSDKWPDPIFDAQSEGLRNALAFSFDVGKKDEFTWGLTANRLFQKKLTNNGINFGYEEYHGNHSSHLGARFKTKFLPFLQKLYE